MLIYSKLGAYVAFFWIHMQRESHGLKDETARGSRSTMKAQFGNALLNMMRTDSVRTTYSLHPVLLHM